MSPENPPQVEDRIVRCRLILSLVALGAVFADPTTPFVSTRLPLVSGRFIIDPNVLVVMGLHLAYSVAAFFALRKQWMPVDRFAMWTQWLDVLLGAAIALMTEGATSPFYAFFAFAVIVAGFRSGMGQAMLVTAVSVMLYLFMIVISAPGNLNVYIMRPAYLAIVGYLVGYLGQQRLEMQSEIRLLEAAEERHRIARDLHDGFAQALAGINLKIEGCRRLLLRDRGADALAELTDLQGSVHREYDELREYMKQLAGIPLSSMKPALASSTRVALNVSVDGSIDLIDHVLQISREGVSNVRRHAAASAARISIFTEDSGVRISIEDDGVGLSNQSTPWSIASRVRELGGEIRLDRQEGPGSHLMILLPQA